MMTAALGSRKLFDQNWKRILFWGGICALSQVFICLVGLPSELNRRILIESTLSLGYLFILWIPVDQRVSHIKIFDTQHKQHKT